MRTIIEIVGVEKRVSNGGDPYHRTHAILDDGTEATGYGSDFKVDDKVEVFFHKDTVKMRKPLKVA